MSGAATPKPSSDNLSKQAAALSKKKIAGSGYPDFLSSVDEAPDFHDPFSDLSLFLSQKIKQEMEEHGSAKKWSLKIQDELIKKITPDFQKKFPHYRLGIAALRKIWEKISYYSQQIQGEKEATLSDGKLNTHFFIKENLKEYIHLNNPYQLQPYHWAHQLAMKVSECIATIDGTRPKLDELTQVIWSVQRHLLANISPTKMKCPYDEFDKIDHLIVKTILEISANEPHLSQPQLQQKVKESIESLRELPAFSSSDKITSTICALLAQKLYPTSSFHTRFLAQQKNALSHFVKRHTSLCKGAHSLPDLVRRITALYSLASQLPKSLTREEIRAALRSFYFPSEPKPHLPQSVWAFISAEGMLLHAQNMSDTEEVWQAIIAAYEETAFLPSLSSQEMEFLEIVIWKRLSETEGLLEKLPYVVGQRIEEEIANILIDNPAQSFSSLVHLAVQFFQRTKELSLHKKWSEIERKIQNWTLQGDMLCRFICLDPDNNLLKLIHQKWHEQKEQKLSHLEFVSHICIEYLHAFPSLAMYAPQLSRRVWILYKYFWYASLTSPEESSFDRFLKWHAADLTTENKLPHLEEICAKTLPLVPFDPSSCKKLIG
jgi:hypothetical protein